MDKSNQKPNLFHYAYTELAQDAFICWLLSWAKPENKKQNETLHHLAMALLKRIFEKHRKEYPDPIGTICIIQQHKNIDILVEVNKSFSIIVEDKIHSTEHDNQLSRYIGIVKEDYPLNQILPVYLQTGNQGNYTAVKDAGYESISRTELLDILKSSNPQQINNNILSDYLEYLENIETWTNAYADRLSVEWDNYAWQGFYCALQKLLTRDDANWGYVPNQQGGFWGFWWSWYSDEENKCSVYIQLEGKKLCFRIEVDALENNKTLREKWSERILKAAQKYNLNNIVRPGHMGTGNTMAIAIYDGEYIHFDSNGRLNMEKTVDVLHKVEKVLSEAKSLHT
jgi:hypothetical protein